MCMRWMLDDLARLVDESTFILLSALSRGVVVGAWCVVTFLCK